MEYWDGFWNASMVNVPDAVIQKQYDNEMYKLGAASRENSRPISLQAMGGWPQYSFSPTTGAWTAQHFFLHWKYSADDEFLKEKGYPFVSEVATALKQLSYINEDGYRVLPLSTSPEIFDNSLQAWFHTMTNYDLSLMKFTFGAAAEMAK